MSKIRVYELAKELNVSSKNLINLLMEEFGVEVKNHMSVIEDEDATLIKELLGDTSSESEGKKSLVDEYEDELAESLNKGVKRKKKNKKELEKESLANLSIAPATCYLPLMHSPHYDLISQYVSPREKNKVTGGTSAEALKSLDVKGVLINHFESRTRPDEVESQIKECLENNLKVYLIITGTLEEYYYQYTSEVLMMHLQVFLKDVSPKYYSKIVVIYEPSFLIGEEKALPINELTPW